MFNLQPAMDGPTLQVQASHWRLFLPIFLNYYCTVFQVTYSQITYQRKRGTPPWMQTDLRRWNSQNQTIFERFLTLEDIYEYLDKLEQSYKNLVSVENVGKTYEGRALKLIRITASNLKQKPVIWIDAGTHGREWISISTALFLVDQLVIQYDKDPIINQMVSEFEWCILPVLNPDGYSYTWTHDRMWRKNRVSNPFTNCPGVDLNRNYDFFFGGPRSNPDPCDEKYPGLRPFSEAETRTVQNMTKILGYRMKAFITLHSFDQLWMVPFGPIKIRPYQYKEMIALAKMATKALKKLYGTHYRVGTISNLAGYVGGSSIDWVHWSTGVKYAFAVELPDTGHYGFSLPPEYILPIGNEIFVAIQVIALELLETSQKIRIH